MKRALMRRIAAKKGQPTDTSKDHDFTDWDEVSGFAADLLELARTASV
jgi:menaquinone-dependent protoporphyrinogen oxidase